MAFRLSSSPSRFCILPPWADMPSPTRPSQAGDRSRWAGEPDNQAPASEQLQSTDNVPTQQEHNSRTSQVQCSGHSSNYQYRPSVPRTVIWSTTAPSGELGSPLREPPASDQGYSSITFKASISQPQSGRLPSTRRPLTLLQTKALDAIFSLFESQHTTHQSGAVSSAGNSSGGSTNRTKQENQSSGGKRNLEDSGRGSNDDEDGDDFGRGKKPPPKKSRPSSSSRSESGANRTFACPFGRKDPARYSQCFKYELKRIRDVKQHLRRCHRRPIHCALCGKLFRDEDTRDIHLREMKCTPKELPEIEGMTGSQLAQLTSRCSAKMTEEDQWFVVWDIVFPGHRRPESPYVVGQMVQELLAFRDFFIRSGPAIVHERLVEENSYNAETLLRMVEEGFQRIADRWSRSTHPKQHEGTRDQTNSHDPRSGPGPGPEPSSPTPAHPTTTIGEPPCAKSASPTRTERETQHDIEQSPNDRQGPGRLDFGTTYLDYNMSHSETQNFFDGSFPVSKANVGSMRVAEVDMTSFFRDNLDPQAVDHMSSYSLMGTMEGSNLGSLGYETGVAWVGTYGAEASGQGDRDDRNGDGASGGSKNDGKSDGPNEQGHDQDGNQGGYGSCWPGSQWGGGYGGVDRSRQHGGDGKGAREGLMREMAIHVKQS